MEKEKIIVARNSYPEGSPSEYLGAEVSIGLLTAERITELKSMLQNDKLFEEMAGKWDETYIGSTYLTDLMDVNEVYHKNGLIYYEDLSETHDNEIIGPTSTDNWVFAEDWGWDEVPYREPGYIEIPQEDFVILNLRTQDFYFKANGEFPIDKKISDTDLGIEDKFIVQPGLDVFSLGDYGFPYFNILHSVFVNDIKLNSDESYEDSIYYSSHLIFKDGKVIAWLATNNNDHFFPFDWQVESEIPCISPHLKESDPEVYEAAVKSLIEII